MELLRSKQRCEHKILLRCRVVSCVYSAFLFTDFKHHECYKIVDRNGVAAVSPQAILKDCGTPLLEHFRMFTPQQRKLILYRCIIKKFGLLKGEKDLNTEKLREDIARDAKLPRHIADTFTARSYQCDSLRGRDNLVACFDTLCPGLLSSVNFNLQ